MSKKVKVTIFDPVSNINVKIGEELTLVHDPKSKSFQYDEKALDVFRDGTKLGVVGGKAGQTVVGDSVTNVALFDQLEPNVEKGPTGVFTAKAVVWEETQVVFRNGTTKRAFIVRVDVPEEAVLSMKKFVLNVRGSIREYKGKTAVLKEIQSGRKHLLQLQKNDDGNLVTFFKNDDGEEVLAGLVSKADVGDIDQLMAFVEALDKTGQRASVWAVQAIGNAYLAEFVEEIKTFNDVLDGKVVLTLDQIKQEKLDEGIGSPKVFEEIQKYLEESKVEEKHIKGVFESMMKYPEEVLHRIRKPENPYINMGVNMVKKSVVYLNKGKHLNFIGDKGIGKNVLIETMSWVYQRPLFSSGYHSQIDKMDILGGKTFETEVVNGQQVTKMTFEKELLAQAMEVGGLFNPDEINAADPSILFLFHPVTDGRRELEVPGYGLVKAHPNFSVISTMNEDYLGTNDLNEAFKRRFTHFRFPQAESISDLLTKKNPGAHPTHIKMCDEVYGSVLKLVRGGQLTNDCVSVSNYEDVLDVVEDLGMKEALIDNIVNQISDESYRGTIESLIDDVVG